MIGYLENNQAQVEVEQGDDGNVTVTVSTVDEEKTIDMHDADAVSVRFDAGLDEHGGTASPTIESFRYERYMSGRCPPELEL